MGKKPEQRRNPYIAFVNYSKAFDMVNRKLLFSILGKMGCPPKLIRIIKKLYTDVNARLIVDGELTQAFEYNSGVKPPGSVKVTTYILDNLCAVIDMRMC